MNNPDATFGLAWQHHQAGRLAQAEELYRQIIQGNPRHADAWCFLGAACQAQGKLEEAEADYRQAILLLPHHPSAPNCLGIVLSQRGKHDEAAGVFEALLLRQPADAEAHNNLGLVREKQNRKEDAVAHYRRAIMLRPDSPDAHNNLANVLTEEGKLQEALGHYDKAILARPRFADAYFNRATPRFLLGDFTGGWSDYESRWHQPGFVPPTYHQPRWDGSHLQRKTILLWAEQGLGDTLQFIRYAPLVKQRGGRVIVACQPALLQLLRDCPGIDELVAKDAPPPPFDVYAPLLSLPGIMGTTLANVPALVPYLHADPALVDHWRGELASKAAILQGVSKQRRGILAIGIAWQGNPTYRKDRQRSVPLTAFEELAQISGVQLVSLQKGPGTEQLAPFVAGHSKAGQSNVLDLSERLDNAAGPFRDTAAIMRVLDLVIASDSAVAHLAGALAVPVWVALPRMPDWRWLLQRQDSPWYPTMRLFRQSQDGQWSDVFDGIVREVKALIAEGKE